MPNPAEHVEEDGSRCRQMARVTLGIVLKRLEGEAQEGVVSLDRVRDLAERLTADNALLSACCGKMARDCQSDFLSYRFDAERKNYLGRAVVRPFAAYLDAGSDGIDRCHLPQFLLALRMMLGNETQAGLAERCQRTAASHRKQGGMMDWTGYYEDVETKAVFEAVLVGIARAFHRFDMRKEWLLTVMNSGPKSAGEFTLRHKTLILSSLFAPECLNGYFCERRQAFMAKWNEPPERLFRPLLVGLNGLAGKV